MCVFHTLWHPCLSELASQGGSLGWQPRLWPHSSWWLSGQCALESTRLGSNLSIALLAVWPWICHFSLNLCVLRGRFKMTVTSHLLP